jgi:hypothetical protein
MHDIWAKSAVFSQLNANKRKRSRKIANACCDLICVFPLALVAGFRVLRTKKGDSAQAVQGSGIVDLPGSGRFPCHHR